MKTIEEVLDEFLFEQWARLSSKTYSGYEDAIYYFEEYLNGWAHKYLSEIDQIRLNEFYEEEGKRYCEVFGPEYISSLEIKDFLGHFMIRNVLTSKTFLETMGKVMHKLVKWMHEKAYMSHDNYEALNLLVKRLKVDMPVAEEVSDLLCLYALSHSVKNYSETLDDFFIITEIKTGKLWFESYSDGKNIGPVLVSEKSVPCARWVGLFASCLQKQGTTGGFWKAGTCIPN